MTEQRPFLRATYTTGRVIERTHSCSPWGLKLPAPDGRPILFEVRGAAPSQLQHCRRMAHPKTGQVVNLDEVAS